MQEKKANDQEVDWIARERLVDGFFVVEKIRLKHRTNAGEMSPELSWYLLQRPDAVCAIVYNTDRDILYFVRQFRLGIAAKGDPAWAVELAAGVVEPGESHSEAVLREVREELGFEARDPRQVQVMYPSPAILSERIILYYIEVTDSQRVSDGGGTIHEYEDLEIIEVQASEATGVIERYQITDAKTLYGLAWFIANKSLRPDR